MRTLLLVTLLALTGCGTPRFSHVENPVFKDFGKAKEAGEKYWCVLVVEWRE